MASTNQVRKKTKTHGGLRTVVYRNTAGKTFLARVVSAGTGSSLNLYIIDRRRDNVAGRSLSNVALATTMKSTNAYFNTLS